MTKEITIIIKLIKLIVHNDETRYYGILEVPDKLYP